MSGLHTLSASFSSLVLSIQPCLSLPVLLAAKSRNAWQSLCIGEVETKKKDFTCVGNGSDLNLPEFAWIGLFRGKSRGTSYSQ